MFKKIILGICLVIVLFFGFVFGYGIVYAKIIPGWDQPWDPPNYYSLTSISWADTFNPSFFFRDLGQQGGNIYDHTRHQKEISTLSSLQDTLYILMARLGIQQKNSTPLSIAVTEEHRANIDAISAEAIDINRSQSILDLLHGKVFRSSQRFDEGTNAYDKEVQMTHLQNAYQGFAKEAQKASRARDKTNQAAEAIMTEVQTAQGDMQLKQAQNELEALKQAELSRRNALLANVAALQALQQKAETDEKLAQQRRTERAQVHFGDPYHPTEDEKKLYQRPEGLGFVEFKMGG